MRMQVEAPAPRCAHTCVVHGSSLFVFGGYDGRRYFEDCFEFPLKKPTEEPVLSLSGDLHSCIRRSVHACMHAYLLACMRTGDLQPMVDNPQFSDVTFVVEGQHVHGHKFILYARCEYFRKMFTSGYRESTDKMITIPDVRHEVFLAVLSYLYTGTAKDIDPQMAVEVISIANLYSIDPLKVRHASEKLNSSQVFATRPRTPAPSPPRTCFPATSYLPPTAPHSHGQSLHRAPYSLHLAPCTLQPSPFDPHPRTWCVCFPSSVADLVGTSHHISHLNTSHISSSPHGSASVRT